jgi:hypothetical protein
MPVVTLIRPMLLNEGDGFLRRYGVGQYFLGSEAWSAYVMAHCANGRPENDDVQITDPGPPTKLFGLAGEPLANTTWPPA